jgi:hypothetical protein
MQGARSLSVARMQIPGYGDMLEVRASAANVECLQPGLKRTLVAQANFGNSRWLVGRFGWEEAADPTKITAKACGSWIAEAARGSTAYPWSFSNSSYQVTVQLPGHWSG